MKNNSLVNGFYFEGHTIAVRQPIDSDIYSGEWSSWYNSYAITKNNSHGVYPVSVDDEAAYVKGRAGRKDCLLFAIVNKDNGVLLGNAALQGIDYINRKANIAITIGVAGGISTCVEVYGLLLDHAFCRLNMNRVGDATHDRLGSLVKMLSVLGIKEEGRSREYFLRDGLYSDAIHFGVLSRDFLLLKSRRGGNILFGDLDELNCAIVAAVKSTHSA